MPNNVTNNNFSVSDVCQLDGQQLKARKRCFGYDDELESQRRFIALFVDFLLNKETMVLAKKKGTIESIKFPPQFSNIDTAVGVFVKIISEMSSIKILMRETSFNEHLQSLTCFNWQFYLKVRRQSMLKREVSSL